MVFPRNKRHPKLNANCFDDNHSCIEIATNQDMYMDLTSLCLHL